MNLSFVKINKMHLILFTLFVANLVDQPTPEVKIEQGILSGKINEDGTIFEYVGIPYAATNRSMRFQTPLPPPKWNGIFKATDENNMCTQHIFSGLIGVEDCLKINIFVPALATGPFPVMFYIHGGAFIMGNGGKLFFGPEFIVKHNVILVTFNYRLGPLGFLCLGIKEAPGNAGLKDQLAALRWVKKNIAAFGGDPDNITIFGESAGGASVSLFLASEATDGLFKRAIIQSGPSLSNWAINRRPVWSASLLAKEYGYNTEDPHELHSIFSKLSARELMKPMVKKPFDVHWETQLIQLPCVEKLLPGVEPFITDIPYNLINRHPKNVSIIHGTTSKEGLFFVKLDSEEDLDVKNNQYLFTTDLEFGSNNEKDLVGKNVKDFYFGNEQISVKTLLNLTDYYTDIYFGVPAILESNLYIQHTNANIYNYYFKYDGYRNYMKLFLGFSHVPGACHGDEVLYLFNGRIWPFRIYRDDQKIIDYMTEMWTNFAKFGNPTPKSKTTDLPVWEPSRKDKLQFLYIEDNLYMGPMPRPKSYDMWRDIYKKYRRKGVSLIPKKIRNC